jgi:hypothetical protein
MRDRTLSAALTLALILAGSALEIGPELERDQVVD